MLVLISSIHGAAWYGDVEKVIKELNRGADVNEYNERGETPLIAALKGWYYGPSVRLGPFIFKVRTAVKVNGWKLVIRYLLSHGADPNLRDGSKDSLCPLHWAVRVGKEAVDLLLKYRANPNCRAKDGTTALHYAAYYGKVEVLISLLRAGGDINVRDNHGRTPLHYAASECNISVIRYLEGISSVDWGATDNYGHTVAMYSTSKCSAEDVLKLATERVNNVLHRDKYGLNLFHWMILNAEDEKEIVRFIIFAYGEIPGLLEAKVPPCGMNALHFAAITNHPRVFIKLLNVGIKDYPVNVHRCFKNIPNGEFSAHRLLRLNSAKLLFDKDKPAVSTPDLGIPSFY